MSEQSSLGPIYDFSPESPYWRVVDNVGRRDEHYDAEAPIEASGRDMARVRRGPDAATVLRGLPAALRGDVRIEPHGPSFVMQSPMEIAPPVPLSAAQAIIRMAQGPLRPPGGGIAGAR